MRNTYRGIFFARINLLFRLRVRLSELLAFGGFVFRRPIEASRAHYQVGIVDSDRDRPVIAIAPLIVRDVGQRILIVQFVRDELESVTGVLDGFGSVRQSARLGGQCAKEIRRDQVAIANRLLALAVDARGRKGAGRRHRGALFGTWYVDQRFPLRFGLGLFGLGLRLLLHVLPFQAGARRERTAAARYIYRFRAAIVARFVLNRISDDSGARRQLDRALIGRLFARGVNTVRQHHNGFSPLNLVHFLIDGQVDRIVETRQETALQ